ncbi:MAG: heme exporter protein CcmD [Gammaproteobacteria bacterium]|nr:heme exporter protein CcmD [Gammaproteobacteria bacterium]MDX2486790.1 heme exporter protein CcmD [Gammaproteobacteria bacterium]
MMKEFFNMGGYALYVWGSFGMTALLMIAEPILVRNKRKVTLQRVSRYVRSKSARQSTNSSGEME